MKMFFCANCQGNVPADDAYLLGRKVICGPCVDGFKKAVDSVLDIEMPLVKWVFAQLDDGWTETRDLEEGTYDD